MAARPLTRSSGPPHRSHDPAPQTPTLALTLALAGKRTIDADTREALRHALQVLFDTLAARLGELSVRARSEAAFGRRFSTASARLTLISGLADGVDQLGAEVFLRRGDDACDTRRLLGAVLPCERTEFVRNSHVDKVAEFDRLWNECAFVVDLAGAMPPSPGRQAEPPTVEQANKDRRARGDAFSAQSEVMLRNADILVAVDAPHDVGRTGGTRESVRTALDLGLPVILLRLGEPGLAILRTRADFDEPVVEAGDAARAALAALADEVTGYGDAAHEDDYARSVTAELFSDDVPRGAALAGLWAWFERRFRKAAGPDRPPAPSPRPLAYEAYKERASRLADAYAGLYRGSFLAGYGLAVLAIAAATLSLVLMSEPVASRLSPPVVFAAFLGLGVVKLSAVISILALARRAHDRRLAHRAADFRYLTERLRAMCYLPEVGWMRSPANWSLPYTTRVAAQGLMDRLLASILRQASPLQTLNGTRQDKVIRLSLRDAETIIREGWLADQVRYHRRNHATLEAMSRWLEAANRTLNRVVIAAAALDLVIILAEWLAPLTRAGVLHTVATPVLVTIAAIVPAVVASFNGVRFQSECTRLADRSRQMAVELARLARLPPGRADHRPRMIEVLRLAEDASRLTLGEVAEWSAIYGKDFPEI